MFIKISQNITYTQCVFIQKGKRKMSSQPPDGSHLKYIEFHGTWASILDFRPQPWTTLREAIKINLLITLLRLRGWVWPCWRVIKVACVRHTHFTLIHSTQSSEHWTLNTSHPHISVNANVNANAHILSKDKSWGRTTVELQALKSELKWWERVGKIVHC